MNTYEQSQYLASKGFVSEGYYYHLTDYAVNEYNDVKYVKSCITTCGYSETYIRYILKGCKSVNLDTCVNLLMGFGLDVTSTNMALCFDFDVESYQNDREFTESELESQIYAMREENKKLKRKKNV